LSDHPDVDMISFTGSTAVGRRIYEHAARRIQRVGLELGGKSACIVLEDANFERAVQSCVRTCFANAGQICAAQSRLLVPRQRARAAAEIAKSVAESFVMGDPTSPGTTLGPLISEGQRSRV